MVLVDAIGAAWRNAATRSVALARRWRSRFYFSSRPRHGDARPLFSGTLVLDPRGGLLQADDPRRGPPACCSPSASATRASSTGLGQGEFYALVLALTLSSLLLSAATDIVTLYLSLEMVSITSYVLVAYLKGDRMSNEASLKYLLFGAVSTGTMLYGLVLLYGMTGETSLSGIHTVLAGGLERENRLAIYATACSSPSGSASRSRPCPSTSGAPTSTRAPRRPSRPCSRWCPRPPASPSWCASSTRGLSLARRRVPGTSQGIVDWPFVLMVISVLTMTVGNVAALTQTNMKRMLAYSSIAHAGYALMGVVALSENGVEGVLVYVVAYVLMNLGAFLVVTLVHPQDGTFDLRDYPGLYRRSPFLTVTMAHLPALARRHPAARRLPGQALRLRARSSNGARLRLVRGGRRAQRRHRRLLLLPRPPHHGHRPGQRGPRPHRLARRRPPEPRRPRPRQRRPARAALARHRGVDVQLPRPLAHSID